MTLQEIHALLRARFAEAIAEWSAPEAGDAWIGVTPEALHEVCQVLKDDPATSFDFLRIVTAVDWSDRLSSIYHLYSYRHGHSAVLRVDLPREAPRVDSVSDLWPTAEWHEREAWDMMGIVYLGHPMLRRILLPEDWEGHPLRKDYKQPEEYHGISNV